MCFFLYQLLSCLQPCPSSCAYNALRLLHVNPQKSRCEFAMLHLSKFPRFPELFTNNTMLNQFCDKCSACKCTNECLQIQLRQGCNVGRHWCICINLGDQPGNLTDMHDFRSLGLLNYHAKAPWRSKPTTMQCRTWTCDIGGLCWGTFRKMQPQKVQNIFMKQLLTNTVRSVRSFCWVETTLPVSSQRANTGIEGCVIF